MSTVAIATIVAVGLLIVALAAALLWVIVLLRRISRTLGLVSFGVAAIADRARPIGPVLQEANERLVGVASALEELTAETETSPTTT